VPSPTATRFTFSQHVLLLAVPSLAALLIRLLGATLRYEDVFPPDAEAPVPGDAIPGPTIFAFWHRSLLVGAHRFRDRGIAILISRSIGFQPYLGTPNSTLIRLIGIEVRSRLALPYRIFYCLDRSVPRNPRYPPHCPRHSLHPRQPPARARHLLLQNPIIPKTEPSPQNSVRLPPKVEVFYPKNIGKFALSRGPRSRASPISLKIKEIDTKTQVACLPCSTCYSINSK